MYYTSLEQSKKLTELGIKPETADMSYSFDDGNYYINTSKYSRWIVPKWSNPNLVLPCWSLAALLELMSNIRLMHFNGLFWCQYCEEAISDFPLYATAEYDNPIDACYELICWLLENDYIKKN